MIRLAAIALFLLSLFMPSCTKSHTFPPAQIPDSRQQQQEPVIPSEPPESTSSRSPSDMVPRITIDELLQKILNDADIIIVDAREEPELQYNEEHIAGAISAPLSVIVAGEWRPDKIDQEIILYCS